jgi:hypothetical protein
VFRAPWHDHLEEEGEDEVALMAVAGSKAVVAAALMDVAVVGVEEEEGEAEAETVTVIVGEGVVMEEGTTSADVGEVEGAVVVGMGTDTGRTDISVNVDLLYL